MINSKKKNNKLKVKYYWFILLFLIIDILMGLYYKTSPFNLELLLVSYVVGIFVPFYISRNDKNNIFKIIYLLIMVFSHYYLLIKAFMENNRDCISGFDCFGKGLAFLDPVIITPIIVFITTIIYKIINDKE